MDIVDWRRVYIWDPESEAPLDSVFLCLLKTSEYLGFNGTFGRNSEFTWTCWLGGLQILQLVSGDREPGVDQT